MTDAEREALLAKQEQKGLTSAEWALLREENVRRFSAELDKLFGGVDAPSR